MKHVSHIQFAAVWVGLLVYSITKAAGVPNWNGFMNPDPDCYTMAFISGFTAHAIMKVWKS